MAPLKPSFDGALELVGGGLRVAGRQRGEGGKALGMRARPRRAAGRSTRRVSVDRDVGR